MMQEPAGRRDRAHYRYRLCGVVVHSGSAFAGHYYSYIRVGVPASCQLPASSLHSPPKAHSVAFDLIDRGWLEGIWVCSWQAAC